MIGNADQLAARFDLSRVTACDSEVLALLLARSPGQLADRVREAVALLDPESPQAFLVLERNVLVAFRRGHPLYLLHRPEGDYLCSRAVAEAELLPDGVPMQWGQ